MLVSQAKGLTLKMRSKIPAQLSATCHTPHTIRATRNNNENNNNENNNNENGNNNYYDDVMFFPTNKSEPNEKS